MSKYDPKDLNGVMPAMITSINKDETINKEGLRKIINHLIAENVNGLYVTGSTGETFLMSPEEKKEVLDIIVEEVNGRVPVIAHVGSIGTKITTDLAKYATHAGVDALSALPPFYYNFSNEEMRSRGSEELFSSYCDKLGEVHEEGIAAYGSDNDMRLTGLHETQSIDTFSYGVSDRGASIRIPVYTVEHNWNGYLEDRRPASNADPYKILAHIVGTLTK